MSFLLFPFRFIAFLFSWLGSTIGLVIAAFVAALLTSWVLRELVWNGVINWSGGTITICCVVSFILTLISGGKK